MKSAAKLVVIIALATSASGAVAQNAQHGSESTKEFKAVNMSMMKNMHVAYTGNPDVDFRTHMIPHHQGAIAMSRSLLDGGGRNAYIHGMAKHVIREQTAENDAMRALLPGDAAAG